VPGDADDGGGNLRTRPGQKNIADRARTKNIVARTGFAGKNSGATVNGPEIFLDEPILPGSFSNAKAI